MSEHGITDAVYIGDTQGDADACKEADVPFVFAEYGFGSVKEADNTIRHFLIFSPCFRQILCNQTDLLPAARITLTPTQTGVIYLFIGGAL